MISAHTQSARPNSESYPGEMSLSDRRSKSETKPVPYPSIDNRRISRQSGAGTRNLRAPGS